MPPALINHGEKIAVALVVVLAIYMVWSTARDDAIMPPRPQGQVEAEFSIIDRALANPGQPNLRPAPDVGRHIRNRLSLPAESVSQPLLAFIHEIWSLGETTDLQYPPYLYGFELGRPQLEVGDKVGSLELRIIPPVAQRALPRGGQPGRIRDGMTGFRHTRNISARESFENSVDVLGVQIQRRQADGPWQALPQAGNPIGLVPVNRLNELWAVTDVSEWQTYEFRARVLAAATGPMEEGRPTLGNEVLVFAGTSPLPSTNAAWEEQDNLAWQGVPLAVPTAERAADTMRAQLMTAVNRPLRSNEQVYLGNWSPLVSEQVSSTTRFVLLRVSPPIQQGDQPRVQFGLTRKFGENWIPLVRQNVEIGGMVGNPEEIIRIGDRNQPIDLSTPFKLVEVALEAERIAHYEIRNTSDGGQRVLSLTPRIDRAARTVTLENTATGRQMKMVQLARTIVVRPATDILQNYPDREPGTINEQALFEADPMGFRQPRLTLPEPIWRDADDPTFAQLFPQEAARMDIQTRYLELPDGRFLIIDAYNPMRIFTFVRPGSQLDRAVDADEGDEQDRGD